MVPAPKTKMYGFCLMTILLLVMGAFVIANIGRGEKKVSAVSIVVGRRHNNGESGLT